MLAGRLAVGYSQTSQSGEDGCAAFPELDPTSDEVENARVAGVEIRRYRAEDHVLFHCLSGLVRGLELGLRGRNRHGTARVSVEKSGTC